MLRTKGRPPDTDLAVLERPGSSNSNSAPFAKSDLKTQCTNGGRAQRCRNPHCKCRLPLPADNLRDAFCCAACYAVFYRARCVVCEQPITRKSERQRVCRRPKCRSQFRRDRARFLGGRYPYGPVADISLGNPIKSGLKSGIKSDRAWRKIAGPDAAEINYRIPLDPDFAARIVRANKAHWSRAALIQPGDPPINLVGGYQFPAAP